MRLLLAHFSHVFQFFLILLFVDAYRMESSYETHQNMALTLQKYCHIQYGGLSKKLKHKPCSCTDSDHYIST